MEPTRLRENYRVFQRITTRWADNDQFGHVNNARFYEFFDAAVNQTLISWGYDPLTSPTIGLVVETSANFLGPISFPVALDIGVSVERLGSSSVVYRLGVFEANTETNAAAVGRFVQVWCDRHSRKSTMIPHQLRPLLESILSNSSTKETSAGVATAPISVPKTMLTAVLYDCTLKPPYAVSKPLHLERLPIPIPRSNDEVLVKVEYSSLCHSDLSVVNGTRIRPLPMALGHEAAGRMVSTGQKCILVFVPSCRADCRNCKRGRFALCDPAAAANGAGNLITGPSVLAEGRVKTHLGVSAFSEYVMVARNSVVPIDEDIPLSIAAIFGCAALTGMGAVYNSVAVNKGDSVCVFGLGAVGIFAVLAAKTLGARVYAIDPLPSKRKLMSEWIPEEYCLPPDGIPIGTQFDFVIECVGSAKVLERSLSLVSRGGTVVAVGLPHPSQSITASALEFAGRGIRLVGSYMGDSDPQKDIPKYLNLWRHGALPNLERLIDIVPLEKINESLDDLEAGRVVRRLFSTARSSEVKSRL